MASNYQFYPAKADLIFLPIANPGRPKTMGYAGSEEFIRLQFEEYLLALLASVRYRMYSEQTNDDAKSLLSDIGEYQKLVRAT